MLMTFAGVNAKADDDSRPRHLETGNGAVPSPRQITRHLNSKFPSSFVAAISLPQFKTAPFPAAIAEDWGNSFSHAAV
jgi:hypothetical protein